MSNKVYEALLTTFRLGERIKSAVPNSAQCSTKYTLLKIMQFGVLSLPKFEGLPHKDLGRAL